MKHILFGSNVEEKILHLYLRTNFDQIKFSYKYR